MFLNIESASEDIHIWFKLGSFFLFGVATLEHL